MHHITHLQPKRAGWLITCLLELQSSCPILRFSLYGKRLGHFWRYVCNKINPLFQCSQSLITDQLITQEHWEPGSAAASTSISHQARIKKLTCASRSTQPKLANRKRPWKGRQSVLYWPHHPQSLSLLIQMCLLAPVHLKACDRCILYFHQ